MKPVLFLLLILLIGSNLPATINKTELEELYSNKKYAILLEKTVGLLNINGNSLSKDDKEFLVYYTGVAYIGNKNIEIGKSYFMKLEEEFPNGKYLKYVYREYIRLFDKDKVKKTFYLKKLSSEFPKTKEAFNAFVILGKQYLKERKFNYAINVFEKIVNEWKMGDENPETYILLTLSYSKTDAYLDALDYLRIAKEKIPKLIRYRPEYLFESAKIYYNTQNFVDSTDGFKRFINIFPKDKRTLDALLYLSKSLSKEKKHFDASLLLTEGLHKNRSLIKYRSLKNKKKYFTLLMNLTQSLIKLSEDERRVFKSRYKSFTDIDKNLIDIKNNSLNYNERRTATILLNNKFLRNGDIEGAIKNYFYFLKKKSDPHIKKRFREYLNQYIKEMKSEESIEKILKLWVLVKPRKSYLSGENLMEIARYLVSIGLLKNGDEIYNHILKYNLYKTFWTTAQIQLAGIKYGNGEYKEFLNLFKKMSLENKSKDEFILYFVNSLQRTGQSDKANLIIKDFPMKEISNIYQFNMLKKKGDLLSKEKNIPEALELYKKITTTPFANKNKLDFETKLADLYYLLDQFEESLREYNKIEKTGKNVEWILFQKINIFRKKNDIQNIEIETEKLKKLNPGSFWLKQLEKNV